MNTVHVAQRLVHHRGLLVVAALAAAASLGGCKKNPPAEAATWASNATAHRAAVGTRFAYACPAGGSAGTVWGTDTYTDDSSVCTAAVHAGKITLAEGGTVVFEMRAGMPSYTGSPRNGVTTVDYGTFPASFVFP